MCGILRTPRSEKQQVWISNLVQVSKYLINILSVLRKLGVGREPVLGMWWCCESTAAFLCIATNTGVVGGCDGTSLSLGLKWLMGTLSWKNINKVTKDRFSNLSMQNYLVAPKEIERVIVDNFLLAWELRSEGQRKEVWTKWKAV